MRRWDKFIMIELTKLVPGLIVTVSLIGMTVTWTNACETEPAFLTPLIKTGKLDEARFVSIVENLTDVLSYSGFFTVNPEYGSNLWFWYFPAQNKDPTAPLILWMNGGPGASTMFDLFNEHGPFYVNSSMELTLRNTSWTNTHSMLYIDTPVGTGYSFTEDDRGYVTTQEEVARDVYAALIQFFTVFPQQKDKDLYVAGQSYGGKYAPSVAYKIHTENQNENNPLKMNLKGLLTISGWTDPVSHLYYGAYLNTIGLIDSNEKKHFVEEEAKIQQNIVEGNYGQCFDILKSLLMSPGNSFSNFSGYAIYFSFMEPGIPTDFFYSDTFVVLPHVRKALNVGNTTFNSSSSIVRDKLHEDFCKSVRPWVEQLLDAGYKTLIVSPQLDVIVNVPGVERFVHELSWSGKLEFANATKSIWRVGGIVSGYEKSARNLHYLVMRNAGHVMVYDQQEWSFEMIHKFTGTSM